MASWRHTRLHGDCAENTTKQGQLLLPVELVIYDRGLLSSQLSGQLNSFYNRLLSAIVDSLYGVIFITGRLKSSSFILYEDN